MRIRAILERRAKGFCRRLVRDKRGGTLVEVLIGILILALIIACVPPVLLMILKYQYAWNEQRIA